MKKIIKALAQDILAQNPEPVVRYRLLRDVLKVERRHPDLLAARRGIWGSRWVKGLVAEQWEDGGWGAFHSRDTSRKQKIPTTEVGVARALSLGLDASDPLLERACGYIRHVMQGDIPFPDRSEKNDRWSTGVRMFLASTLSLLQPGDPLLNVDRELWLEIARRTFHSGEYNPEAEVQAHAALTGATVKGSFLVINGKHQLNILGSIPGTLPEELEFALLRWLWDRSAGIGYLNVPLGTLPTGKNSGYIDCWLASLELLARLFPAWVKFAGKPLEWLWAQRDDQGYWDLGPRPLSIVKLPLSESWRKKIDRQFDWTTRILVLLRNYMDQMSWES